MFNLKSLCQSLFNPIHRYTAHEWYEGSIEDETQGNFYSAIQKINAAIAISPSNELYRRHASERCWRRNGRLDRGVQTELRPSAPYPVALIPVRNRVAFLIHHIQVLDHFINLFDVADFPFDIIVEDRKGSIGGDNWKSVRRALISNKRVFKVKKLSQVLARGIPYEFLVSIQPYYEGLLDRLGRNNIRLMYGYGKSAWQFSEQVNNPYDFVLSLGPYATRKMSDQLHKKTYEIGYPRYDFLSERKYFIRKKIRARLGIREDETVLLWLPTWGDHSSIGSFVNELSSLTNEYRIHVKLHASSTVNDLELATRLESLGFFVHTQESLRLRDLFAMADASLHDFGGTGFSALYCYTPPIFLKTTSRTEIENSIGVDSQEFYVWEKLGQIEVGTLAQFLRVFTSRPVSASTSKYLDACNELRFVYFGTHYNNSSENAVKAIKCILQNHASKNR